MQLKKRLDSQSLETEELSKYQVVSIFD